MRPRILLTNDDGIHAPGIALVEAALAPTCDITIVAPAVEQSGRGAGITPFDAIHYHPCRWEGNTDAWVVSGTPSDCVKVALAAILETAPHLIISGANHGSNAGRCIFYSGTIGATITATLKSLPAIAFSFTHELHDDHSIPQLTHHFLENTPPPGTLININIPASPIKGVRLTRQGEALWDDDIATEPHPSQGLLARLGGALQLLSEHPESDTALLEQGYITATPLHIHTLTDTAYIASQRNAFESLDLRTCASKR